MTSRDLSYQDELIALFGTLVDVMFCVKIIDGSYLEVNDAFVRRTGRSRIGDVVGRSAADLFVPELAERYEEQDRHVFATGEPLRDELEVIRRPNGELGWYLTTKLPIVDDGRVAAIASVSRDLKTPSTESIALQSLQAVVAYVREHIGEAIRVGTIAEAAGCSTDQLERRMKTVFGLTPKQYVLRVQVERASELLTGTDRPLAEIAALTGFYDQSDMSRRFARLMNQTPSQVRAEAQAQEPS